MYVRDARNREEVWLLDHIEAMGLDDTAFRSRDYVIAIDETSNEKAGFGRIRIHKSDTDQDVCELTSIGVLEGWRNQGVGAHIIERLLEYANDQDFDRVYSLVPIPDYFAQFGFEPVDPTAIPAALQTRLTEKRDISADPVVPMTIEIDAFTMPDRLRERFKDARAIQEKEPPTGTEPHESAAEEFGIDPDEATYKYDPAGRRR